MQVLVTGVNGFVGKHLAKELAGRGVAVIGVGREVKLSAQLTKVVSQYLVCDLADDKAVSALPLDNIHGVISLAGLAQIGASFADPEKYKQINVAVLAVLGSELLKRGLKPRVIAVSSGSVYDNKQPMPLTENSRLAQVSSPYALSKILMEQACAELRGQGLDCVVVRPFNHIGPGQEAGFLVPDLYEKIHEAKKSGGIVEVGDLTTKRDYTDVRDVVRAYADLCLANSLQDDVYNVCSGHSVSGETVLQTLLEVMHAKDKLNIRTDSSLLRPSDPPELYGSFDRLKQDIGWQPGIPFDQTIKDFVAASQ